MNLTTSFTDPNALVVLVARKLDLLTQMHAVAHGVARFVHSSPKMASWGSSWAAGANDLAVFMTSKKALAAFKLLPGAIGLTGPEWDDHVVVFRGTAEAAHLLNQFKFKQP